MKEPKIIMKKSKEGSYFGTEKSHNDFRSVCNYCEQIIMKEEELKTVFNQPKGITGQFHEGCFGKEIAKKLFGIKVKT